MTSTPPARGDMPPLSRPAPAPVPGPLDDRFWDLVEERFVRLAEDHPEFATFVGIHAFDDRLSDGSRDAVIGEIAAERAYLSRLEALAEEDLSPEVRFECELERNNVRKALFDLETHRVWERRSTAMDAVGDGLFAIFARDFAPLPERLDSLASRMEAIPAFLRRSRSRATAPQVRLWQSLEIEAAHEMPSLFDEIVAAGASLGDAERERLTRASQRAASAVGEYANWLEASLARAVDDWPLGREAYDELIGLRAFDGLDADAILEIGYEQLAANKAGRVEVARRLDPSADEATVVDSIKADHPATFDEALDGYRNAMLRARSYIVAQGIATMPADERISVIPTPDYLRRVIPFAAYFEPPKFDAAPSGIYVVTPSVDGQAGAMREHNWSSISNTSIHEAYPGHHLQLTVASRHPSLVRLLTDAPEFVEGWGMYCEQMMREEGFDAEPRYWLSLYTDAIWRSCRIILDIRMHRGEVGVEEAVDFLAGQTRFERANAQAEVFRYTYTPTYQLSYLLGKVLLLQLRDDQRRRLGERFVLREFHDSLLRNGTLPLAFHRRLLERPAEPSGGNADGTHSAA